MRQFLLLLRKELGFWFRRPGVHIFAGLFLVFGLLTLGSMAGDWEFVRVGNSGGLEKADSPARMIQFSLILGLFTIMNLAAAAGGAATRDVTEGMHALVYSTPVPKWALLGSRYLGALAVGAYLYYALPLGMILGRALLPGLEAERIGAFDPVGTLVGITAWGLPNLVLTVSLFFAVGTVTRRMFPIYIGGVFLFVGYLGSSAFLADLDDSAIAVMVDPFGVTALGELTRYWTPAESNTLLPLPAGMALANRVLWSFIGLGALVLGYLGTRLDQFGWQPLSRLRRPDSSPEARATSTQMTVPTVNRAFGVSARLTQLVALCRRALGDVIGHRYFWAFVGAALLFELLNATAIGTMYGTDTWPTTYQVLEVFEGTLGIFLLVILTFYAGDLVWSERDLRQDQLLDSAPVPSALPMAAKLLALTAVVLGLHTTILVLGPLVQLINGYTELELGLYLQALYGLSLLDWLPFVALAMAVHAVVNHKVTGHVLLVAWYMAMIFRTSWGFELNLPWFGSDPGRSYSDMNGWGFTLGPFLLYRAQWLLASAGLLGLARLAWLRGTDTGVRQRLTEARRRLDRPTAALLVGSAAGVLLTGSALGYQTLVVGEYEHSVTGLRNQAAYERTYRQDWLDAPHPQVTAVDVRVDLFPDQGVAQVDGTLTVTNPHDVPIEQMLVSLPDDDDLVSIAFGVPYTETVDPDQGVHHWTLSRPLRPGEETTLTWSVRYAQRGMLNQGQETSVVRNGSFLHHYEVFPVFGYEESAELSDPADRRTYDLPERPRMLDLDDPTARLHNYLTDDAHRIDSSIRVSTVAGQIPLAPGNLVDRGEDGDRVWRQYRSENILYFLAFLSAEYEVATSDAGPVPLEVYHHAGHAYNVDRMLDGMAKSLTMFERDFGPYDHDVLRIVEFPRYASYAQAFPTMVPFSESIGFIARLTDPDEDIDYPFYITAHEVAHQWWAHQLIGGRGQGATVLSESLAQYSALKVMEQEYGPDQIDRFLRYESDRYFRGRGAERDKELPLMRVENQPYIHYQKGGSILYGLSQRIGQEPFDHAIRDFLRQYKHVGPPYPNSRDFVEHLKTRFPAHERALVDGFERIVLYDLRLEEATAVSAGDGWLLTLEVKATTKVADETGVEQEERFRDTVGVRIEDVDGDEHLASVQVDGDGTLELQLPYEPAHAVLDGRALFLDRDRDDNEADVTR